jgi:hypothetical protein
MQQPRGDAIRPNRDEPKPDDRAALLTTSSGQVMPPDEAEEYTLLWDAAAEMSRANVQSVERNWLRLMDAVWRGDLARDARLTFFSPTPEGREFFVYERETLAEMLLGHGALDRGERSIDELRHWRVVDYQSQPGDLGKIFAPDPEGRCGLAVVTRELDRWRKHNPRSVRRPRKTKSEDDLRVRKQIEAVLAARRGCWSDPTKRPALRQQARLIHEQLRKATPPVELSQETIRQILSGKYAPMVRQGMLGEPPLSG